MSDGVHFTNFPLWEDMDFAQNCTVFGNWLSSFLMPNPWDTREKMGASFPLSIEYFLTATPSNFSYPETPDDQQALMIEINEWFTFNLYNHLNGTDDFWYLSDEFLERAVWTPLEYCPAEYCKALGYTGNADLTGIGVSQMCHRGSGMRLINLGARLILRRSHTRDLLPVRIHSLADQHMAQSQAQG